MTPDERAAIRAEDVAAEISMAVVQAIRNGKDAVEAVRPLVESVRVAGLKEAAEIARADEYLFFTYGETFDPVSGMAAKNIAETIEARAKEKQP